MRGLIHFAVIAASAAAFADGGEQELVKQETPNAWHLTIGPVMAPRVRVKVRAPRVTMPRLQTFGTSASGAGGNVVPDPSAGYVDRVYADGYVKPDEGTEDPDSIISGLTWNWGADNVAAQYSDGVMEFHTDAARWSESSSSTSFGGGSGYASDRDILLGVEAMGGWTFFDDKTFDAAIDAGFRFYGSGDLDAQSRYGTSVKTTRSASRYVDSYDASGWTDVPSGSYEGTPGGPGRILGATPTRREERVSSTSDTRTYYYNSSASLDYRLWDLRLGPTVGWKATDWLTVRGGVYGLIGLVDANLWAETGAANGMRRARKSCCEAVFGMAAGLSAQINLTDNLFLVGGAEYDWWADDASLKAGGASANIKLSDFTVSLALGVEF